MTTHKTKEELAREYVRYDKCEALAKYSSHEHTFLAGYEACESRAIEEKKELEKLRWFVSKMNEHVLPGTNDTKDSALIAFKKVVAERDRLFSELGKYADIPSFEYWKERAEKAEKYCKGLVRLTKEALDQIGE